MAAGSRRLTTLSPGSDGGLRVDVAVQDVGRAINPTLIEGQIDLALISERPQDRRVTARPLFYDEYVAQTQAPDTIEIRSQKLHATKRPVPQPKSSTVFGLDSAITCSTKACRLARPGLELFSRNGGRDSERRVAAEPMARRRMDGACATRRALDQGS